MEKYILKKLEMLVKKAYKKNEIPVGCIIVKNNKIISSAYNKKEKEKNPLYHAEILAISKACKKNKNWRLDDCKMYVTLEPCEMCKNIIAETRISEVVYIIKSKTQKKIMTNYIKCDTEEEKFKKMLTSFFKEKR